MPRRPLLRTSAAIADRRRMPSGRLNGTGTHNHRQGLRYLARSDDAPASPARLRLGHVLLPESAFCDARAGQSVLAGDGVGHPGPRHHLAQYRWHGGALRRVRHPLRARPLGTLPTAQFSDGQRRMDAAASRVLDPAAAVPPLRRRSLRVFGIRCAARLRCSADRLFCLPAVLGLATDCRTAGGVDARLPRHAFLAPCAGRIPSLCPSAARPRSAAAGVGAARHLAGRSRGTRPGPAAPGLAAGPRAGGSSARCWREWAELEPRSRALLGLCDPVGGRGRSEGDALAH